MPDLDSLLKSAIEKPGSPTPKRKFSRGIRPDHVSRGETLPQFHEQVAANLVTTEPVTTPRTPSTAENNTIAPDMVTTNLAITKTVVAEVANSNVETTKPVGTNPVIPKTVSTIKETTKVVATKRVAANSGSTYAPAALPNFTRIPNQVMACLEREDFSTRELRVLIVIIRETLGWGRAFAELSMSDIAKRTNISQPKVPAAVSALEGRGAIIRERQEKQGKNRYAVCASFFQKWASADPVTTGLSANPESVAAELGTEVSPDLGVGDGSQNGSNFQFGFSNDSNGLEYKNGSLNKTLKERLNKSLSPQENLIRNTDEIFSELFQDHSAKSREREFEKFKNLTSQFPTEGETILEVARAVKNRGVDLRGQPIGSLMAYLELAYPQERIPFLEGKEKAQRRDARIRSEQEVKIREEEELEAAEKIFLANLERFKTEIPEPEERMNLVRELCADAIWLKDLESQTALRIAVSKWAQTK